MSVAYVDASALTKLILDEPESASMRRWYIEAERVLCSRIGLVETRRAARRFAHDAAHLEVVLRSVEASEFDPDIERLAASIGPVSVRTLDAIHLATAMQLRSQLDAFVTYDDRLADAARALGLSVVRPA